MCSTTCPDRNHRKQIEQIQVSSVITYARIYGTGDFYPHPSTSVKVKLGEHQLHGDNVGILFVNNMLL